MTSNVSPVLVCEIHGPMIRRADGWHCPGWDGEGCQAGFPVPPGAYGRLLTGRTRWPGVQVQIPGTHNPQERSIT